MPENEDPELEQEKKSKVISNEELEALQKDKENLNRGIAKIRDESQTKSARIQELERQNAELSKEPKPVVSDEERLKNLLQNSGYVKKDELEKIEKEKQIQELENVRDTSINKWLEENPDFDTNEMWSKLDKEFTENYKSQTTQQGWIRVFDKIKKDVSGGNLKEQGKVEAIIEQKNKGRLTLGGGSQGTPSDSEGAIESFMKQRPNLKATKEQLEKQKAELDALYPKKKEK